MKFYSTNRYDEFLALIDRRFTIHVSRASSLSRAKQAGPRPVDVGLSLVGFKFFGLRVGLGQLPLL